MTNITASIRATIGTIWLIVAMTLLSEVSAPFKAFLTSITGHHWTAKGLFAVIFFALIYLLSAKAKEPKSFLASVALVITSVILGSAIIVLFFVWHFFAKI